MKIKWSGRIGNVASAVEGRRWGQAAAWAAGAAALLCLEPALAKSAGELGTMWAGFGTPLTKAVTALSYPLGAGAGATALYKLKANRDNPQHHTVGPVFGWAMVCVGLLYLPQTVKNSNDSIWGTGSTANQSAGMDNLTQ